MCVYVHACMCVWVHMCMYIFASFSPTKVYWFKFIVRLLIKILVYKESVRDEREYDESEDKKEK